MNLSGSVGRASFSARSASRSTGTTVASMYCRTGSPAAALAGTGARGGTGAAVASGAGGGGEGTGGEPTVDAEREV